MSDPSDTARVARLWGRVADVYDTSVPFFSVLGRRLVEALEPAPGEHVLDIATGRGACLFPAARAVGDAGCAVGIDLSSEMVAATAIDISRRGVPNATVLTADAQHLAFAAGCFDVVTCSQVMNQFSDPGAAASELRRVMRPGARIGVLRDLGVESQWDFVAEVAAAFVDRLSAPPPPKRAVDVVGVLGDAGFADIDRTEETIELVFPDEQAWWDWHWTTGRGRTNVDPLPEDARREYRSAVFARMQPLRTTAGFPMELPIERVVARR
ncbi:MAG TPA: methyltransferase domain-containing protein [Acidimicrobiia bacterium]